MRLDDDGYLDLEVPDKAAEGGYRTVTLDVYAVSNQLADLHASLAGKPDAEYTGALAELVRSLGAPAGTSHRLNCRIRDAVVERVVALKKADAGDSPSAG